MKTKKIALLFTSFFLLTTVLFAQNNEPAYKDGFLKRFGVAAKIGTYGPGFDLHTSLLPNLKARIGFSYLGYSINQTETFSADGVNGSYVDGEFNNMSFKFPNANILVDFYPVKSGIFCFTAGAYIGNNSIKVKGHAEGDFYWDDIVIEPNKNTGYFDGQIVLGDKVKPYFGIGLGRTISKSRVGFRFDLGLVYQGAYTVESDYSKSNITQSLNSELDLPVSSDVIKLWPMLSFSLSYRIK